MDRFDNVRIKKKWCSTKIDETTVFNEYQSVKMIRKYTVINKTFKV